MTRPLGRAKPSLDQTLAHFGVKGMKWGVKRLPNNIKEPNPISSTPHKFNSTRALSSKSLSSEQNRAKTEDLLKKIGNRKATGPDAKIATKAKKGEKWANGLALGSIAFVAGVQIAANVLTRG